MLLCTTGSSEHLHPAQRGPLSTSPPAQQGPLSTSPPARIDAPCRLQRGYICSQVAEAVEQAQVLNRAKEMIGEENGHGVPSQCPHDEIHHSPEKQQPNESWPKDNHSEVKAGKLGRTLKNRFGVWPLAFLWFGEDSCISCGACLAWRLCSHQFPEAASIGQGSPCARRGGNAVWALQV